METNPRDCGRVAAVVIPDNTSPYPVHVHAASYRSGDPVTQGLQPVHYEVEGIEVGSHADHPFPESVTGPGPRRGVTSDPSQVYLFFVAMWCYSIGSVVFGVAVSELKCRARRA